MFCLNCGEKLDDGATVCSECGFDIEKDKASTKSSNESSANKNIVIGGLIIVAIFILIVGIASLNSGDIITINGVNFNIPDGFEEDVTLRCDDEPLGYGGSYYARFYKDNDGNMINLGVTSGIGYSSNDEFSFAENHNAVEKNIGGKEGWFGQDEFNQGYGQAQYGYFFSYLDGGNMVLIFASDEHLIEEVIV